jgi:tetratricopeptide (TPR) repeat protein
MPRDNFTQPIIKSLRERVALRCSNSDCRVPTTAPSDKSIDGVNNIGVAAHICAASKGGARYRAEMTSEERKSFHNGIWLCANCSIKIDRDDKTYTEELLKRWKFQAEKTAELEHGQNSPNTVPQKLVDGLFKKLDEKDIALQERDSVITEWMEKYKELENQLLKRTDDVAKEAESLLENGELDKAQNSLKEALANDLENAAANAFSLAYIEMLQLNYAGAKNYYQQAAKLAPENGQYLSYLGMHLYNLGEYVEAESVMLTDLANEEKRLGKEHQDVATSLCNLAVVYESQGKYDQAEALHIRSLAIREKILDKEHIDIAISLNNLAMVYGKQGKYEQTEPLFLRSLAIKEKVLGKYDSSLALTLNNLAVLYQQQGQFKKAEPLLLRSLAINENSLGKDHPQVALNLNNLAELFHEQGKYKQAEYLFQRSLAIYKKVFGKEHLNVATGLHNLAALYITQNKYNRAESLLKHSLEILEKILGGNHPDIEKCLISISFLYMKQEKFEQAEPYFARALEIKDKNYPNFEELQKIYDSILSQYKK